MKKTVGIILRENVADYNEIPLYACRRDMIQFLKKYNINIIGIPIIFGNENEFDKIKETIDLCDGIISPGGSKIHDIDYKIVKYLHEIDKPTLGICLGMQIMGKLFNEKVRTKIESGKHYTEKEYVHNVRIKKDSLLYKIIGEETIKVNSRHKRQIPYTNLDCVAYSEDNVLEAIEDKSKKFFIGLQWHPESLIEDVYSNRLFDYFINVI
ncbi:gamma-glutamyl-gamma-aminobutyrate hydrolase family protein [uncultured Clostridium sp.]|uniref:gamma-glutamyl-gamma-aminobutyrate hydrolase family protein n=1 Tax=uncultured Clostridium sp. TaxID=59620 RepID=UPI002625D470|nr:gamma-glutamyl-gamma-aminobutyrate hydrolase family protein [uncultured Clostridium sp.]MCI8470057.1 C26 family cysteine hydrolase domain-containing family [Clostridia bacterium]